MLGGEEALLAVPARVDRAAAAHGDHDGGDVRALEALRQILDQLLGRGVGVVRHKEQPRLRLVADEAVHTLQQVPALGGDAHVGDHAVDRHMVFLAVIEHPLDDPLANVDLDDDAVGMAKDLVPLPVQDLGENVQIGPLGDRARQIPRVVEHRQPHPHPVRDRADVLGVDLVLFQPADDLFPLGGIVDHAQEGRAQLDIGDILRDVAAHAAVDDLHIAGVAPGGQIQVVREALDVHEDRPDNYDGHMLPPVFSLSLVSDMF